MYLADYHTHCELSFDSKTPIGKMINAAKAAGMQEICLTDHLDIYFPNAKEVTVYDWKRYQEVHDSVQADGIAVKRGIELGEATRDFAYAEKVIAKMPPMDFVIGSQHQLSGKYNFDDMIDRHPTTPEEAKSYIADNLALVLQLAKWGRFSVLGHLTLPLRYFSERDKVSVSFDGFEAEVEEIFRTLIQNGCGIECNTNRGHTPLPDGKWLRMYRGLGGEIITIGTDAHTTDFVGCHVREVQQLLKDCGFAYHCTFDKMKPSFHKL